jgi:WD40 repeat protein
VWKAKTGKLVSEMEGHFNWVQSAAFSPDARLVVTASRDKTARIWETRTGKVIAIFQLQMGNEFNVAFSPDAQRIATASDEGIVRLYSCEVCGSIKKLRDTALNRMP